MTKTLQVMTAQQKERGRERGWITSLDLILIPLFMQLNIELVLWWLIILWTLWASAKLRALPVQRTLPPIAFFFFLFRPPYGIRSSQAKDQSRASVVTCTTAAAAPGPGPTVPGLGSNLHPSAVKMPSIPLWHSGNSSPSISFFLR